MPGMGRTKTIHKDLPPRMVARVMARGRRLYYYNAADGKRIPLGDDINLARMKWAELEAGQSAGLHTFKAIAERYRAEVLPRECCRRVRQAHPGCAGGPCRSVAG